MEELIKKLIEAGKTEALSSKEAALTAAVDLGYAREEAEEILKNAERFPVGDDELEKVSGGVALYRPPVKKNTAKYEYFYRCDKCGKEYDRYSLFSFDICPKCGGILTLFSKEIMGR